MKWDQLVLRRVLSLNLAQHQRFVQRMRDMPVFTSQFDASSGIACRLSSTVHDIQCRYFLILRFETNQDRNDRLGRVEGRLGAMTFAFWYRPQQPDMETNPYPPNRLLRAL